VEISGGCFYGGLIIDNVKRASAKPEANGIDTLME